MAIKGQAKADYMRDYMRRRRDALKAGVSHVRPGKTDEEIEALKAELAAANAEIAILKTLHWSNLSIGAGRYLSRAATLAGSYTVDWRALHKPVSRGGNSEKRLLPIAGESFGANFSPWAKDGRRRLKTRLLGNFPTLDEARAVCQEHARAVT